MSSARDLTLIDENTPRPRAVIFGVKAKKLSAAEKAFFAAANPLGFIIFARNCDTPAQLRKLTDDLRATMGRNIPVLVDQEGGRVARLKPPHWKAHHSAGHYGDRFTMDPAIGRGELGKAMDELAGELVKAGINVNCAPVLDVRYPETHDAIGDRAYNADPRVVGEMGGLVAQTFLARDVLPVIKHIPGQGRAQSDSHKDLPHVTTGTADMEKTDFVPYRMMLRNNFTSAVWGMVSHIVYDAVDAKNPASCSADVIGDLIRRRLGFDGLLLSDDLSMDALATYGDAAARAVHVLNAGCDIALHCNGKLAEMKKVAKDVPLMTDEAVARYNRSVRWLQSNQPGLDRLKA